MDKFYSTVDRLKLHNHPAAYFVEDFAEMHNPTGAKWIFDFLKQDLVNENLYHVRFSLPQEPGSKLIFTIEFFPKQPGQPPRFTLIQKTCKNQ